MSGATERQASGGKPPASSDRPVMPDGYGIPESVEGTLPWSYVDEKMSEARNYWIATVRPDCRPHVMPVWGVWLNGSLYIEGSPETIRHRNIASNPHVTVHLENGSQVVIMEGEAHETGKPVPELGQELSKAYSSKYASMGYSPGPDNWDEGGLYQFTPKKVFAWTNFPQDTTRWRLGNDNGTQS